MSAWVSLTVRQPELHLSVVVVIVFSAALSVIVVVIVVVVIVVVIVIKAALLADEVRRVVDAAVADVARALRIGARGRFTRLRSP